MSADILARYSNLKPSGLVVDAFKTDGAMKLLVNPRMLMDANRAANWPTPTLRILTDHFDKGLWEDPVVVRTMTIDGETLGIGDGNGRTLAITTVPDILKQVGVDGNLRVTDATKNYLDQLGVKETRPLTLAELGRLVISDSTKTAEVSGPRAAHWALRIAQEEFRRLGDNQISGLGALELLSRPQAEKRQLLYGNMLPQETRTALQRLDEVIGSQLGTRAEILLPNALWLMAENRDTLPPAAGVTHQLTGLIRHPDVTRKLDVEFKNDPAARPDATAAVLGNLVNLVTNTTQPEDRRKLIGGVVADLTNPLLAWDTLASLSQANSAKTYIDTARKAKLEAARADSRADYMTAHYQDFWVYIYERNDRKRIADLAEKLPDFERRLVDSFANFPPEERRHAQNLVHKARLADAESQTASVTIASLAENYGLPAKTVQQLRSRLANHREILAATNNGTRELGTNTKLVSQGAQEALRDATVIMARNGLVVELGLQLNSAQTQELDKLLGTQLDTNLVGGRISETNVVSASRTIGHNLGEALRQVQQHSPRDLQAVLNKGMTLDHALSVARPVQEVPLKATDNKGLSENELNWLLETYSPENAATLRKYLMLGREIPVELEPGIREHRDLLNQALQAIAQRRRDQEAKMVNRLNVDEDNTYRSSR